jgi:ankyrin repeat protein
MAQQDADQAVHEAARAGLTDKLAEMLATDPSLIDAKGIDARTPLHCAGTVAMAALLLDHGARIDALDEDHESTPAQWRIGESPDVARFLLDRGAKADIFLAAALGDVALAQRLVIEDRGCLAHRIGKLPEFPPLGYRGRGGTIYQWTLRFNSYPHQIALIKGHQTMFDFLYGESDTVTRLLVNCLLARRAEAEAIANQHPEIVPELPDVDRELVAKYCWETNTNYDAVKLMLDLGFPVAHPERSHGYTPLHNAAWAGSGDLVELLIARGHPVDIRDPAYDATPLGYALHDCLVERRHPEGEFARVVKALLEAGSPLKELKYPTGDAALDEVLRAYI